MLTLITGTPGAGKSLLAVWEFAKPVPGSFVEQSDQSLPAVPRKLYSNIKNLLVEHTHIEAVDLETWHEWSKPGDVILFDEVQHVWRPRGLGVKVPPCIAALEEHRHGGVDLILITQHPMLLDANIRRLCNQHLHLRRITRASAMVYEWDRAANPGQTKDCIHSRLWWHPKKAYALYQSAVLHTKPTTRFPKIALVGVAAVAGLFYMGPMAYGRLTGSFAAPAVVAQKDARPVHQVQPSVLPLAAASAALPASFAAPLVPGVLPASFAPPGAAAVAVLSGCVATPKHCGCFDSTGAPFKTEPGVCESHILGNSEPGQKVDLSAVPELAGRRFDDVEVLAFLSKRRNFK